ncbi:MAG: GNAT family N-acetyltransferase [Pseudomonadota bacterium]
MTEFTITREDAKSSGRYIAQLDGYPDAEMTYSRAGETLLIIDHTAVPDELRGKSAGLALVTRAVEDARADGTKILPLCPFAKAQFDKHPDWADVLNKRG